MMTPNAQGASAPDVSAPHHLLEQQRDHLRTAMSGVFCLQFLIRNNVSQYFGAPEADLVSTGLQDALATQINAVQHHFGKLSNAIDDFLGVR